MNRKFFIDSENVGDSWIALLPVIAEGDELVVFYTAKSPHMSYKSLIALKNSATEVEFIECCEGCNALDFQLCTELGYRMQSGGEDEFFIVSNDTGYDAVVRYWKKRNRPVRRIQGKQCAQLEQVPSVRQQPEKEIPVKIATASEPTVKAAEPEPTGKAVEPQKENPVKLDAVAESAELPAETAKAEHCEISPAPEADTTAKEIFYIVGKHNLQDLHEALVQLYGSKQGFSYYGSFKSPDAELTEFAAKHPKMTAEEKQRSYCEIAFRQSEKPLTMPEDFPHFAVDAWRKKKNLNSFRAALQSKYGKDNEFYSLIKPHIKILDALN